jgi:hypothetical protein
MDWDYVWIAVFINFLIVYIVPRAFKKPTGIKVLDDIVLYLNAQKSFLLSSSIVLALVVWASHYYIDNRSDSTSATSPEMRPFSAK